MDENEGAFDDYLSQLDADIAKEKVELPSVPADVPKSSAESKVKSTERSAVLEYDCLLNISFIGSCQVRFIGFVGVHAT